MPTDQDLARALSGATRECPSCHDQEPLKSGIDARSYRPDAGVPLPCPVCQGTGRVFVLGERARKACPDAKYHPYLDGMNGHPDGGATCAACHVDGWLSMLLEEPEACPGCPDCKLAAWVIVEPYAGCGGSGIIQAWRIGLLIELLEEAGFVVEYRRKLWFVDDVFNISLTGNPSLAVAACEALGVGSEVKG